MSEKTRKNEDGTSKAKARDPPDSQSDGIGDEKPVRKSRKSEEAKQTDDREQEADVGQWRAKLHGRGGLPRELAPRLGCSICAASTQRSAAAAARRRCACARVNASSRVRSPVLAPLHPLP
eukprot:6214117-Pleurochrysis_carterae.AAC.1